VKKPRKVELALHRLMAQLTSAHLGVDGSGEEVMKIRASSLCVLLPPHQPMTQLASASVRLRLASRKESRERIQHDAIVLRVDPGCFGQSIAGNKYISERTLKNAVYYVPSCRDFGAAPYSAVHDG